MFGQRAGYVHSQFHGFMDLWVRSQPGTLHRCGTEHGQHLGMVIICVGVKIKTHTVQVLGSTFCPLEEAANVTIFTSKFSLAETNKNTAGHKATDKHTYRSILIEEGKMCLVNF